MSRYIDAEKVAKGLECCSADTADCHNCPYSEFAEGNCFDNAKKDALVLIKSQEQRIKELTEENERLMREKTALECVVATARNQAKNDTVRQMQDRLIDTLKHYPQRCGDCFKEKIDQIAKEILEKG